MSKIRKIFIIAFFAVIVVFPMNARADYTNIPITINKEYNYKSLESKYETGWNNRLQFTLLEPGRIRFLIQNLSSPKQSYYKYFSYLTH